MTATLAPARPGAGGSRATFVPLAARETRRFALNPVFLFAVALIVYALRACPAPGSPRSTPSTRIRRSSSAGSA